MFVIAAADVSAHRRDEYLQATRLAVEPDRAELELALTPGIAVADAIIAGIDRDRDGMLSAHEKQAYVATVLDAIELEIDGRTLRVEAGASSFPDLDAFRHGEATIQLHSVAVLPRLSNGDHRLFYRNTHRRDVSVYLANALVPTSDRIAITGQRHDRDQHDLTIDFAVGTRTDASTAAWLGGMIAVMVAALLTRRSKPQNEGIRSRHAGRDCRRGDRPARAARAL